MNPIFILLVLIAGVALWFILACLYKPIGAMFLKLWNNSMSKIDDKENTKEKEKKEDEER